MAKKKSLTISKSKDLHGLKVQEAFDCTRDFLDYCREEEFKHVRIITGKSGQIYKELPTWMETLGYDIIITEIGSFIVKVY